MKRFACLFIVVVLTLISVNVYAAVDLSGYWTIKTQDGTGGWMTLVAAGPMKYNGQISLPGCPTSKVEVNGGTVGNPVFAVSYFCWNNSHAFYTGFRSTLANPTTLVNGSFDSSGGQQGPAQYYTAGRLNFTMFKQ